MNKSEIRNLKGENGKVKGEEFSVFRFKPTLSS